jgi:hypothetical protein
MLLTGYLGTPDTARLAAELAGIIRAQKPHAIFACDPVMGDDDALYVKPIWRSDHHRPGVARRCAAAEHLRTGAPHWPDGQGRRRRARGRAGPTAIVGRQGAGRDRHSG